MEGCQYSSTLRVGVSGGNGAVVRLLLDHGADLHAAGEECGNVLQTVACVGNEAIVRFFILFVGVNATSFHNIS